MSHLLRAVMNVCVFGLALLHSAGMAALRADDSSSSPSGGFAYLDAIPFSLGTFSRLVSQPLPGCPHNENSKRDTAMVLENLQSVSAARTIEVDIASEVRVGRRSAAVSTTAETITYNDDTQWCLTDNAGTYHYAFESSVLRIVHLDRRFECSARNLAADWCAPPFAVLALVDPQRALTLSHCRLVQTKEHDGFTFIQLKVRPRNDFELTVFSEATILARQRKPADKYDVIKVTLVDGANEVNYIAHEKPADIHEEYLAAWFKQTRPVIHCDVAHLLPKEWCGAE